VVQRNSHKDMLAYMFRVEVHDSRKVKQLVERLNANRLATALGCLRDEAPVRQPRSPRKTNNLPQHAMRWLNTEWLVWRRKHEQKGN